MPARGLLAHLIPDSLQMNECECVFWQAMAPVAAVLLMHMTAEVRK